MLNRAAEHLESILTTEFAPFPKWGDPAWQQLPSEAKEALLSTAEPLLNKEWPVLPAHVYMEFQRSGNRSRYEIRYCERRKWLLQLTVAECIEGKGRFIDAIIDLIWAICEESTWVVPAHNNSYNIITHGRMTRYALNDFTQKYPFIDLFSAETGAALAWVCYLLDDRLNKESELITLRIGKEIKERIIDPYIETDDMHWMGLCHPHPVNNWNPWINSNILTVLLIMEKDEARRLKGLKKVARSAQRFLDFYAEDGGCDEGPGYFNIAGGAMLDLLEIFYDATDGRFSLYNEPLISNMADYLRHVHISGPYFMNFADAHSRIINTSAGCLLRAGKLIGNDALINFARKMYRDQISPKPWENMFSFDCFQLFRQFKSLLTYTPADACPEAPSSSGSHYFAGIQVSVVRSEGDLFFAAKGGHNQESHNHNDVGSYILYANGQPCVVDAGVGVYSQKTFSDRRYTIWSMQSGYHNTAIINGCDQVEGTEHAAHSACFSEDGMQSRFALNFENAYTPDAMLTSYHREFVLNRKENTLTLTDQVSMSKCVSPVILPILCYLPPVLGEGTAKLNGITLRFNPAQFTASFEEISLNDPENPITSWGKETLHRLLLTRTSALPSDSWTITYTLD